MQSIVDDVYRKTTQKRHYIPIKTGGIEENPDKTWLSLSYLKLVCRRKYSTTISAHDFW